MCRCQSQVPSANRSAETLGSRALRPGSTTNATSPITAVGHPGSTRSQAIASSAMDHAIMVGLAVRHG